MTIAADKSKIAKVLDILLIAALFTLVFALSLRRLADYDLWGHMKAGEYLFKTGAILTTHYFNCSWPEFPYLNHEWLFQAATYGLYFFVGETSLVVLQIFLVMASFYLLFRTARLHSGNIPLIVFILALGVMASSHRFILRPQHFSYVFLLINLYSLHQYTKGKTAYLYLLPPVMLIWVNTHAESLWGIIVPGIFLITESISIWIEKKRYRENNPEQKGVTKEFISKAPSPSPLPTGQAGSPARGEGCNISPPLTPLEWQSLTGLTGGDEGEGDICGFTNDPISNNKSLKKLAMVFLLVIFASLINPFTYKTIIWPLLVMSEQFAGVEELLAPTNVKYLNFWIYFGIFIISVPFAFRKIRIHFLLISIFFAAVAWMANRGIPHFVFASAPVIAAAFSGIELKSWRHRIEAAARPALLIIIVAVLVMIIADRRYFRKFDNVPYPEGAIRFIQEKDIKGNMFNLHGWGGYLVWKLYPSVRTYIDNRFFHRRFFEEYEQIIAGVPEWQLLFDKYNINIVLLDYSLPNNLNIRDQLFNNAGWRLAYWDDYSLLYLKDGPAFKEIIQEFSMRVVNPDTERFKPQGLDSAVLASASKEVLKNITNAKDSWKARYTSGSLRYILGNMSEAVRDFEEALRLSPDTVPAIYFNLGQAYMASGRLSDAEKTFEKFLKYVRDADAYQALWRIYILQGKNKEADLLFKEHLQKR